MSTLEQRTEQAIGRLSRYGKVEDELVADLLEQVAEINDAVGDGVQTSVMQEHIAKARQALDALARRG